MCVVTNPHADMHAANDTCRLKCMQPGWPQRYCPDPHGKKFTLILKPSGDSDHSEDEPEVQQSCCRLECRHKCPDKAKCGHKCCKRVVPNGQPRKVSGSLMACDESDVMNKCKCGICLCDC